MVRGYFYEMACVIAECERVLKPGARLFMVNDNVRYAGASISVDMILSDIAEKLGFSVEHILVFCYRTENPFVSCRVAHRFAGKRKLTGTRLPSRWA